MKRAGSLVIAAVLLSAVAGGICPVAGAAPARAAQAAQKDPPAIRSGVLDEIHLKAQKIGGGVPILLRRFSTTGIDPVATGGGAGDDERARALRATMRDGPDILLESVKAMLSGTRVFGEILPDGAAEIPGDALIVDGRFTKIDTGGRIQRNWTGLGGGTIGVQVAGYVKDAEGRILAEFLHARRSPMGADGGINAQRLAEDAGEIGEDIGTFLIRWAAGGDLRAKVPPQAPPHNTADTE